MDSEAGGIFVSAHMGSWELAGAYLAQRGVPLTAVVLQHRDPRIDELYMNIRRHTGVEIVTVGGAVRQLFDALKHGRFVGIASDRDPSGQGIPLPFFGEVTRMPTGHAKLALRTGAWILPTCIYRRPDGRIAIEVRPPIVPDPAHDTDQSLALRCISILEEFIRARPEQWSSFSDLWDTNAAPQAG
jgi:KDO2-lipid IV(A) lauroyltransferase